MVLLTHIFQCYHYFCFESISYISEFLSTGLTRELQRLCLWLTLVCIQLIITDFSTDYCSCIFSTTSNIVTDKRGKSFSKIILRQYYYNWVGKRSINVVKCEVYRFFVWSVYTAKPKLVYGKIQEYEKTVNCQCLRSSVNIVFLFSFS